jgi:hypothetical protein
MECQGEKNKHYDTFCFMSSIEAPKLQRAPETFVSSMEKTPLLREQSKMVCALQARQFWHEWHSAAGAVMMCIWWDMEGTVHYELLKRNLIVTDERYYQQLRRLGQEIQQNPRVDDME